MRVPIVALVALVLYVSVPAMADTSSRLGLDGLTRRLANHEVGMIEILHVPADLMTRTALTPQMLERQYHHKMTIRDVRGTPHEENVLKALRSTKVAPHPPTADLRWAVIFYDLQGQRVLALYTDKAGRDGFVSEAPVSFSADLHKWLTADFAKCVS